MKLTAKQILAANVQAVLAHAKANPNSWMPTDAKRMAVHRAKNAMNVTIDTLQDIADRAGLEPWHLLVPGLDVENPPLVALSEKERMFYAALKEAARSLPPLPTKDP